MARQIFCQKYKKEMEGLEKAPYAGEFGQKIYDNISQQAWNDWMEYQTKLINELKLKVFEKSAQETIRKHAEEFFFSS